MLRKVNKPFRIIRHRLKTQGLRVTLMWLVGRGIPKLTGVPPLNVSRVTPQLYVGPQYGRLGKRLIERAGISAGVNLRIEFDDAAHGLALAHYCHLPTVDETPPTIAHLAEGARFIAQQIEAGRAVYVHCMGGVGRAPTQAAAYLVTQGHSTDEALDLIRRARPFIDVLPDQLARLREFEATHRAGDLPQPD